ncbi:glycosyltransferase family 4 protein [Pseudoalteromonas sp. SWN29]|uniref:glycosyltransferase family 4 protein n=1 Tax=Pseudoalteromonas sp. SWN29 TaxID=2792064 RepID=UPI0018CE5092|nr:glycosyltransferase family 4 protein [Pseudoalteromonas sp. SWN29]MBH0027522.1 glycosyltransferase family 4 protein [Pseudoalteromonas sp. SWN29]
MKVIIISPSLVFGGGENHIVTLAKKLTQGPIDVYCLNEELFHRLKNIKSVKVKLFRTRISLFLHVLFLVFPKNRHLVLNGLSESRFLSLIFIFNKYTLISHSAEEWGNKFDSSIKDILRTKINGFLLNHRSKKIVAVCEYSKKNLCRSLPLAEIILVYNTAERPSSLMKQLPRSDKQAVIFGYLGRLSAEKGIHVLLSAISNLECSKGINIELKVAGAGNLEGEIDFSSYSKNGVNVEYIGFVDSNVFLSSIDCLLLPSLTEACPLVVLEAMSKKIAVIASDVGGIPELVEHGVNGYLFQKADSVKLSQYIKEIALEPSKLDLFSENAAYVFESKFSPEIFIEKYNRVLFNE